MKIWVSLLSRSNQTIIQPTQTLSTSFSLTLVVEPSPLGLLSHHCLPHRWSNSPPTTSFSLTPFLTLPHTPSALPSTANTTTANNTATAAILGLLPSLITIFSFSWYRTGLMWSLIPIWSRFVVLVLNTHVLF